jgi:hypothetical protein
MPFRTWFYMEVYKTCECRDVGACHGKPSTTMMKSAVRKNGMFCIFCAWQGEHKVRPYKKPDAARLER